MMASRERMLQQQQQYEKAKSGNNGNKKKGQPSKKAEKRAGTNENGRWVSAPTPVAVLTANTIMRNKEFCHALY